jgi:AcrR family transcriptional regulator
LPKTIRKRTRENAEDRRERILDEAIGLIGQRGYYGFTVKELAQKCGLSNAGLLYHFSSKDQLLGAVIGHLESTEAAFMAPLVARAEPQAARGGASLAALKKLLQTMVARAGAHSELGRLHAVLLAESLHRTHPAYDSFRARETAVLGLFARLVAPHVRAPQSTARQLLALMEGLAEQWLRADQSFDLVAEWDRAIASLLPAAAARGRPRT